MSAGKHEAPRPNDPFVAAVILVLVSLLTVVLMLAIADRP
jgi:hypothetical protein